MEHPGTLILAQADHLTGEEIGFAIEQIMSEGANNVYYFPGITKRGRAGCMLLIDINQDEEHKWSRLLAEHLGVYGFHRIQTMHFCSQPRVQLRKVVIRKGNNMLTSEIGYKCADGEPLRGRVEHADAVKLCKQVQRELDVVIPLATMKTHLQSAFHANEKEPFIINL